MSIKINGQEFLSYEEQVLKNKKDIEALAELLNTKVQATFLSTASVESETQIAKSTIQTSQGVPKVGDLVIGTDGFIAKIISIGESIIEISNSLPVLNYMNAINVAFNGFGTEYLTTDANVQAALARLDNVLLSTNDDASAHYVNKSNPHEVTKAQVGLGNVDNTSDANKPVSIAQAAADAAIVNYADEQLDLKENLANKVTNFDTIDDIKYPTTKAITKRTFDKELLTFSLPNRVADYIKFENGKYYYVQRVKKYVLQSSDITTIENLNGTQLAYTSTNFLVGLGGTYHKTRGNAFIKAKLRCDYVDVAVGFENQYYISSTYRLGFVNTLGTFATLAQAQAAFVGTVVYYQLTTPIETEIDDIKTANWLYNLVTQEAWITPTLVNSWVNFGSGTDNASYMKDTLGFVHLKGRVKSGTIGATIFTMPVGYRTNFTKAFVVDSNAMFGRLTIASDGSVVCAVGSNVFVSLDGVSFKAEA